MEHVELKPRRLGWIDALRGLGVIGGIAIGARWLLGPMAGYHGVSASGNGTTTTAEWIWWTATTLPVQHTGLFLIGAAYGAGAAAGLAAATDSEAFGRSHRGRLVVLIGLGLLHGSLLWPGDTLLAIGLTGLLVSGTVESQTERPGGTALTMAAIGGVIAIALLAGTGREVKGSGFEEQREVRSAYAARESAAYRGSFSEGLRTKRRQMWIQTLWNYVQHTLWPLAAGMLGGTWWYRRGRHHRPERWSAARLAASGIALKVTGATVLAATASSAAGVAAWTVLSYGGGGLLAAGLVVGATHAGENCWRRGPGAVAAAAGRNSLSLYLGASLVLGATAQGWGAGLHGTLTPAGAAAMTAAFLAAAAAAAAHTDAAGRRAPAEQALRKLGDRLAKRLRPA